MVRNRAPHGRITSPLHGHIHIAVEAPGTSITCPVVNYTQVNKGSCVSQSMFVCTARGYKAHADLNAPKEILKRGMKLAFAAGTRVTARQGTNLGPALVGAEPGAAGVGCGCGNEETGTSTVDGAASHTSCLDLTLAVRKLGP
ncbi:MAG: zinc ribbon domain-containing protein [Actinomycetota bacterium]|nr:zinc ribbon domain-containing protein [Actinomycetota bacterium]